MKQDATAVLDLQARRALEALGRAGLLSAEARTKYQIGEQSEVAPEFAYQAVADAALAELRTHECFVGAMSWCSTHRPDLYQLASSAFAAVAEGWQTHVPLAEFEERLRAWVECHDAIMRAYKEHKNGVN